MAGAGATLVAMALAASAHAAMITVDTDTDVLLSDADDTFCSLSEAIDASNTDADHGTDCVRVGAGTDDIIDFDISPDGSGAHVITIADSTGLPNITDFVDIDGDLTDPDDIEIDGSGLGTSFSVFTVSAGADGTSFDALSVYGASGFVGNGFDLRADSILISDSFVGTDADDNPIGNAGNGVLINAGASGNTVRNSVLSSNGNRGVLISSSDAGGNDGDDNVITGNMIGTNAAGTAALPNVGGGVLILGDSNGGPDNTRIGGAPVAERNVISGNSGIGVQISMIAASSDPVDGTIVRNNRIGTTEDGETPLPNTSAQPIRIDGNVSNTNIDNNLISGSTGEAILLQDNGTQMAGTNAPSDSVITGNLIGTDAGGDDPLPGGGTDAIAIDGTATHPAERNRIGGTGGLTPGGPCTGDCNVISSAVTGVGINVSGSSSAADVVDTEILGNYVGTDAAGTSDFGNAGLGIFVDRATRTTVGSPSGPNVVSANDGGGLDVSGTSSVDTTIESNLIGVGADGTTALGNDGEGISAGSDATGVVIGGTGAGEGNEIAHNLNQGIEIAGSDGPIAAILGNSLHDNDLAISPGSELGINLAGGDESPPEVVTANDNNDVDVGPNDLNNFPVLTEALAGNSTTVSGTLNTNPEEKSYRIEFFSNAAVDLSGFGEGETFLGATTVTTNASGAASFEATVPGTAGLSEVVSSTATELNGSSDPVMTSELSAPVDVDPAPPPPDPPRDATPPEIELGGKKTQKSSTKIKVKVTCDEDCTVEATGTIKVPKAKGRAATVSAKVTSKLKTASGDLQAGETATLTLKVKGKGRKLLKKALRNGKKSTAKITVTVSDSSGNDGSAKRTVKVKKK